MDLAALRSCGICTWIFGGLGVAGEVRFVSQFLLAFMAIATWFDWPSIVARSNPHFDREIHRTSHHSRENVTNHHHRENGRYNFHYNRKTELPTKALRNTVNIWI